jgi:hypothetical protein
MDINNIELPVTADNIRTVVKYLLDNNLFEQYLNRDDVQIALSKRDKFLNTMQRATRDLTDGQFSIRCSGSGLAFELREPGLRRGKSGYINPDDSKVYRLRTNLEKAVSIMSIDTLEEMAAIIEKELQKR